MAVPQKKKKLIKISAISSACTIVVCGIGGFFYHQNVQEDKQHLKAQYQEQVEKLESIADQSFVGYALNKEIEDGDRITGDDIDEVYLAEKATAEDLFLINLKNRPDDMYYAKTTLKPGTVLTRSMLYENENITDDIREVEYSFIELPSRTEVGDFLDVRIQFPTGDEYILLAKKEVKDVLGMTAWFNLNEGELLYVSSAVVDAYIEQGTRIYAVPYVDAHMQRTSTLTYPVKDNVRDLIASSPNIVDRAMLNLENRNRARLEKSLEAMSIDQKALVENATIQQKSAVEQEAAQRTAEERVNELNAQSQTEQQQNLIGGSDSN